LFEEVESGSGFFEDGRWKMEEGEGREVREVGTRSPIG